MLQVAAVPGRVASAPPARRRHCADGTVPPEHEAASSTERGGRVGAAGNWSFGCADRVRRPSKSSDNKSYGVLAGAGTVRRSKPNFQISGKGIGGSYG